ncbi:hypothetical protein WMF45_43090 [Sorangium sp. So ce448]|uniref:TolB family protein n=1 Tax=Sorangium sp. So ce448 TaxID=3133314 RepID=UPI003F63E95D
MCIPGLQSIALSPDNSTVEIDGRSAAPITFTATGTLSDGTTRALEPGALTWSATRGDDTPPGTVAGGVLAPFASAGGTVRVTASDGCVTGETTVVLHLSAVLGTPSDQGAWAGTPVTGAPAPSIVYPSDQTRFPRNVYRTLFQWRSQGFTEFRLVFTGASSTVTIFTDGAHGLCEGASPAAGCWEVDEATWNYIAGSNAGGTATWTVDALDTSTTPATVRRSAAVEIGFSRQDVKGAIFYWSTTSAGVRRGKISRQTPEDYIVGKPPTTYSDGDKVKCVACHVVSRDGKYMAAPVSANSGNSLWILGITPDAPPDPLVKSVENTDGHVFATISPDDARVVAASKGAMWMVERETGAYVNDLPTGALKGTHPDWSPLGTEVVFATGDGDAPGGASLAHIPYSNGTWGQASVLLAPPAKKTNLFPSFSPDAAWIAFSQGKGGHGDNTAQLMVLGASGGQPVELLNANRVTSNQMTDGQYQNSQPTWAPPGDLNWIAFNTKREYGVVRPEGTQQIWVAAIDVQKADAGQDPSYPAFRVPFQGLDENNHRAYWTLDINEDNSGGGGSGGAGAGGAGAGGSPTEPVCSEILDVGEICDAVNDCCQTGSYCDTVDDGVTYTCIASIR